MGIDRRRFGSQPYDSKPKLTSDMVVGNKTVLTIQSAQEVNGPGGPTVAMVFEEFPDHTYWLNKTQQDALIAAVDAKKLPDDWARMAGHRVPIYKRQNENPETGELVWKLYATPLEEWDQQLAAFDQAKAARTNPPAQAPQRPASPPSRGPARR